MPRNRHRDTATAESDAMASNMSSKARIERKAVQVLQGNIPYRLTVIGSPFNLHTHRIASHRILPTFPLSIYDSASRGSHFLSAIGLDCSVGERA